MLPEKCPNVLYFCDLLNSELHYVLDGMFSFKTSKTCLSQTPFSNLNLIPGKYYKGRGWGPASSLETGKTSSETKKDGSFKFRQMLFTVLINIVAQH